MQLVRGGPGGPRVPIDIRRPPLDNLSVRYSTQTVNGTGYNINEDTCKCVFWDKQKFNSYTVNMLIVYNFRLLKVNTMNFIMNYGPNLAIYKIYL